MKVHESVLGVGVLVAVFAGCASASEAPLAVEAEASLEPISSSFAGYVSVRRDTRECSRPMCGGYFVHELNRSLADRYVPALDLTALGLGPTSERALRDAPDDELVLRGRPGSADPRSGMRALVVTEAYHGMPGVKVTKGDVFYAMAPRDPQVECFAVPCPNEVARPINGSTTRVFDTLRVDRAAWPHVDRDWLAARALSHGGLVAGTFAPPDDSHADRKLVLDASQVFVRLPDRAGPCATGTSAACDSGEVMTFRRTPDRCMVPTGCVKPGICALLIPACGAGYVRVSWRADSGGCNAFACDPAFLSDSR